MTRFQDPSLAPINGVPRRVTIIADGVQTQGEYTGHEYLTGVGYNAGGTLTGRIFILDGDTEYVGTPVVDQKGLSE